MNDTEIAAAVRPRRGRGRASARSQARHTGNVYRLLSRVFPRSYRAKLLTVVLAGTLLPMLVLVVWLLWVRAGARKDRLNAPPPPPDEPPAPPVPRRAPLRPASGPGQVSSSLDLSPHAKPSP